MRNKKGFTLIELLAVIIILGVLMIIAVPSVTKYINDSRKNGYVSTAKNIAGGVRNLINSGSLDLTDKNTTYYVDAECVKLDNGYKSPYGEFLKAYVVVTAAYDNYEYYWTSVDSTGTGVKRLININKLDTDNIETNINSSDITTNRGLDEREYIVVVDSNCQKQARISSEVDIDSSTGKKNVICQRATTLHSDICERTSDKCAYSFNEGTGNEIIYGTIPNGTPKAGDAYDCDVNNDKVFDSETERFYYIASYGNTSSLIYYKNVINNQPYNHVGNNHGPEIAYQYLPNLSEWKNPKIIAPGTRQITNENGGTTTPDGDIDEFTYTDRAARFLTYQEAVAVCNPSSPIGTSNTLQKCKYLLENIYYYSHDGGERGSFWLETPSSNDSSVAYTVSLYNINVSTSSIRLNSAGVRPVITVKTSNIE